MPLVDYAQSDESDEEQKQDAEIPLKETKAPSKPVFQKVVNRSNPHKIRVSLPELSKSTPEDGQEATEPPAKRAKIGSGGFTGFNSLLPAPKRAATTNGGLAHGSRKGALGGGVNLKTGVTPGFSREVESSIDEISREIGSVGTEYLRAENAVGEHKDEISLSVQAEEILDKPNQEPKKQGNPVMFKPLSVARKPQKKKRVAPTEAEGAHITLKTAASQQPKTIPKTSLFAIGDIHETQNTMTILTEEYKPMVYQTPEVKPAHSPLIPNTNPYHGNNDPVENPIVQTSTSSSDAPQCLDTIAADLNLSASAKRQLFGRNGKNPSATNIVNFNTDQEYAANEILRQNGEQVQHNPVRALAAGKHSLKQLVNAASNQKDALEEQFASGRRNKREAGSKYGW